MGCMNGMFEIEAAEKTSKARAMASKRRSMGGERIANGLLERSAATRPKTVLEQRRVPDEPGHVVGPARRCRRGGGERLPARGPRDGAEQRANAGGDARADVHDPAEARCPAQVHQVVADVPSVEIVPDAVQPGDAIHVAHPDAADQAWKKVVRRLSRREQTEDAGDAQFDAARLAQPGKSRFRLALRPGVHRAWRRESAFAQARG